MTQDPHFGKPSCSKSPMTEALSTEEAKRRWEFLIGIENLKAAKAMESDTRKRTFSTFLSSYSSTKAISSHMSDPVSDPFDCSSVAVLPTHDLVENAIQQHLEEWKNLDARKICRKPLVTRAETGLHENGTETENELTTSAAFVPTSHHAEYSENKKKGTNHGGGWRSMEDRLSLPDGFDYSRKSSDEQLMQYETPVPDGYRGDVVISLKNPAERLSYHGELSKLFCSIPSYRELEEQARHGHKVDNTLTLYQEIHDPKSVPDSYALARLRVPDRHGLPQSLSSSSQSSNRKDLDSTILLEFWRKPPKSCTSSGCHRMVAEFLASQTLWDVHVILSNMIEDQLWEKAYGDVALECDSNISVNNSSTTERCERKEDGKSDDKVDTQLNLSGCFFIENTFYKTGSVDYAKPIIEWIDGNKPNGPNLIRRRYLGIHSFNCIKPAKAMKTTKLSEVPFRFNIRYFHSCHGDVETSVIFVDRQMIYHKRGGNESKLPSYPLFHDVWTAPRLPAVPICDACQIYQAVFKTSTNCKTTDGGPRSLCQECCDDLNMLKNDQDSVKLYREWHDQATLSNRIARDDSEAL